MKIRDLALLWHDHKKDFVKKSTMSAYHLLMVNYILPDIGDLKAGDMSNEKMNDYAIGLVERGLSKKSSTDICIVLKMILSHGFENYGIAPVKFKIVYPNRYEKPSPSLEIYTDSEYKQMISYAKEHLTSRRLGILITLLTGVRIGEICALRWRSIDVDNKVIKITETVQRVYTLDENSKKTQVLFDRPKTQSSYRDVPIMNELLPFLKSLKKVMNPDFFVTTGTERYCEPRVYRSYYKKFILEEVGLKRCLKFHGLRHSIASKMIASGVDVKTASTILGHADVATTMNLYCHPTIDNKIAAINKSMGKLFK